jgi:hypothetical protein
LGEIRKANTTESPDKQEVEALKSEVRVLKSKMANMANDIDRLTSLVKEMMNIQPSQELDPVYMAEPGSKKRKVQPMPPSPIKSSHVPIQPVAPIVPLHVSSLPDPSSISDSDLFVEEDPMEFLEGVYMPGSVVPLSVDDRDRVDSLGTISSVDQELLDLFKEEIEETDEMDTNENMPLPDMTTSLQKPHVPVVVRKPEDEALVQQLKDALDSLPESMQQVFVERLVATIADPEAFKTHVDAVTALAAAAAEEAKKRLIEMDEEKEDTTPDVALPLAAATLGAFLAKYSAAMENGNVMKDKLPSIIPMEG